MKLTLRLGDLAKTSPPAPPPRGDFTLWMAALQSTNVSVEVGATSDRLVGKLRLDR